MNEYDKTERRRDSLSIKGLWERAIKSVERCGKESLGELQRGIIKTVDFIQENSDPGKGPKVLLEDAAKAIGEETGIVPVKGEDRAKGIQKDPDEYGK